jgi:hypothetical protein
MRLLIYLTLIIGLLGCSHSNDEEAGSAAPPPGGRKLGEGEAATGTINGKPWTFRSGRAYSYSKYQSSYIVVQLWNEISANPCKEKKGSALQARLTAPLDTTTWNISPEDPFNANISIFFTDLNFKIQPKDNMRADRGEVTFGSINAQEVTGYVAGTFQNPKVGGTSIAGDFAVPFCQSSVLFGDNF